MSRFTRAAALAAGVSSGGTAETGVDHLCGGYQEDRHAYDSTVIGLAELVASAPATDGDRR